MKKKQSNKVFTYLKYSWSAIFGIFMLIFTQYILSVSAVIVFEVPNSYHAGILSLIGIILINIALNSCAWYFTKKYKYGWIAWIMLIILLLGMSALIDKIYCTNTDYCNI